MELVYIYFEDFINFKKEELILNNKFKVNFNKFNLSLDNIEIIEKKQTIYPSNIKSVSVLVGKNATGKSSILKFIKDEHYFRTKKYVKIYYMYSDSEKDEDIYRICSTVDSLKLNGVKINNLNELEFGKYIAVSSKGIEFVELENTYKQNKIVYISDYSLYTGFGSSVYNDSYETKIEHKGIIDLELIKTLLDVYKMEELYNNEKYVFYMEYIKIEHFISLSHFIEKRKEILNKQNNSEYKVFEFKTTVFIIRKIYFNLENELHPNNKDNELTVMKLRAIILYFECLLSMYTIILERTQEKNYQVFNDLMDYISANFVVEDGQSMDYYINKLLEVIDYIHGQELVPYFSISKEDLLILLKYFGSELFLTNSAMSIHVSKETNNKGEFLNIIDIFGNKFVSCIVNALCFQRYINPQNMNVMIVEEIKKGINYMSSAEESYLKLCTIINNALEKNESDTDYITIIFDEPESHMHPELAIKFINSLFMILNSERFNSKNFNLIIATHSPFLLSDILSEDVRYLTKNENNEVSIISRNINTFAGNVLDILNNAYFLSSTIGEFAKTQINKSIEFLNCQENDAEKMQEIEFLISNITEPIVKEYMFRLYNKKIKNVNLVKEIEHLRKDEKELIFKKLKKEFEDV